ncbi:MAG: hypothetical protein ACOH2R_09750 [Pseudomonas sp.]
MAFFDKKALYFGAFSKTARIRSVTRVKMTNGVLSVTPSVAPAKEDYLAHILFALKHEGVNLTILAQALPRIYGV